MSKIFTAYSFDSMVDGFHAYRVIHVSAESREDAAKALYVGGYNSQFLFIDNEPEEVAKSRTGGKMTVYEFAQFLFFEDNEQVPYLNPEELKIATAGF